jgi:hypothetical protein
VAGERDVASDQDAATWRWGDQDLAADRQHAVAHVGHPGSSLQRLVRGGGAVVADFEAELAGLVAVDVDASAARAVGVLGDARRGPG